MTGVRRRVRPRGARLSALAGGALCAAAGLSAGCLVGALAPRTFVTGCGWAPALGRWDSALRAQDLDAPPAIDEGLEAWSTGKGIELKDLKEGDVVNGRVMSTSSVGAFVELSPEGRRFLLKGPPDEILLLRRLEVIKGMVVEEVDLFMERASLRFDGLSDLVRERGLEVYRELQVGDSVGGTVQATASFGEGHRLTLDNGAEALLTGADHELSMIRRGRKVKGLIVDRVDVEGRMVEVHLERSESLAKLREGDIVNGTIVKMATTGKLKTGRKPFRAYQKEAHGKIMRDTPLPRGWFVKLDSGDKAVMKDWDRSGDVFLLKAGERLENLKIERVINSLTDKRLMVSMDESELRDRVSDRGKRVANLEVGDTVNGKALRLHPQGMIVSIGPGMLALLKGPHEDILSVRAGDRLQRLRVTRVNRHYKFVEETRIWVEQDLSTVSKAPKSPAATGRKKHIRPPKVGRVLDGKVVKIVDAGAMVDLIGSTTGLLLRETEDEAQALQEGDFLEGLVVKSVDALTKEVIVSLPDS